MKWLDSLIVSTDMNLSQLGDIVEEDRGAWCATVYGVANSQTELSNWTETTGAQERKKSKKHLGLSELTCYCGVGVGTDNKTREQKNWMML